MEFLIQFLNALANVLIAVAALCAWWQAKKGREGTDRNSIELEKNPAKSAIQTVKLLNGNAPKQDEPTQFKNPLPLM